MMGTRPAVRLTLSSKKRLRLPQHWQVEQLCGTCHVGRPAPRSQQLALTAYGDRSGRRTRDWAVGPVPIGGGTAGPIEPNNRCRWPDRAISAIAAIMDGAMKS